MIKKSLVFPKPDLTDKQERQLRLAETAIDALLELQGTVSVQLLITRDPRIREELEKNTQAAAGTCALSALAQPNISLLISTNKPFSSSNTRPMDGYFPYYFPWHFLYFFPLPQKHGSLRPIF